MRKLGIIFAAMLVCVACGADGTKRGDGTAGHDDVPSGDVGTVTQALGTPVVSSPTIVATNTQMHQGGLATTLVDGPPSALANGTSWLASHWDYGHGGIVHVRTSGTLGAPYNSIPSGSVKATCKRSTTNCPGGNAPYCVSGGTSATTMFTSLARFLDDVVELWFVNSYDAGNGQMLAFVHEERVACSGGTPTNHEGKTRIGLAWSSDGGTSWMYLGRIISPYNDPVNGEPQPFNIQGAPYVINGGNFYVYYIDVDAAGNHGIGISRASVSSVIAAAQTGSLGTNLWHKYNNGTWTNNSMGGLPSFPTNIWGITHVQAIHSSTTGKYYMPLTFMGWPNYAPPPAYINTTVKLYESTDGIAWTPSVTLADEPVPQMAPPSTGYQFCSLADANGAPNAETGGTFFVYCAKYPQDGSQCNLTTPCTNALYRWRIEVGTHGDFYRQSTDFSTVQGPRWFYQYGTSLTNMTYDATNARWHGTDAFDLIYPWSLHPGNTEKPTLTWVAPKAGSVRISGTVRDGDIGCGDGVTESLLLNSTPLATFPNIANGDIIGYTHDIVHSVATGDHIYFSVGSGSANNNYCDSTMWDPSIEYQ